MKAGRHLYGIFIKLDKREPERARRRPKAAFWRVFYKVNKGLFINDFTFPSGAKTGQPKSYGKLSRGGGSTAYVKVCKVKNDLCIRDRGNKMRF